MREILFRAKRIDNGEWVEGYYTKLKWCNNIIHVVIPEGAEIDSVNTLYEAYEINPETICQYTGLKDKNGNRIWENDIVRIGANTLVRWSEKYAGWCLIQRDWIHEHFFGEAFEAKDCEVVGNIFDNPELMEK